MTIEEVLSGFPKKITLKNGKRALIKPLERSDYEGLLNFFLRDVKEEDVVFLKDNVKDPSTIRAWCENINYERVFPIVAVVDNTIVGNASLHMRDFGWARYLGKIRVTVSVNFRKMGLGKAMVKTLEEVATGLLLERLWAEVVEGAQAAGAKLFLDLGYQKAGTLKSIVKAPDGALYDLGIYIKRIA